MDANYNGLKRGAYAPDGSFDERAFGDKRNLAYGTGLIQPLVIALDTAQALKEFPLAGDVIYLDRRSTGEIRFALDMAWAARFPLASNGGMKGIPYKQLLLEWDAQPGKFAYLWTGYAVELIPPNQDISSIGSITQPVTIASRVYGSSFVSGAALVSNTPVNVFAAASNADGVDLVGSLIATENGAASNANTFLLANASAPATITDGDVIHGVRAKIVNASSVFGWSELALPIRIPSGKRLDFISSAAQSGVSLTALYTL